MEEIELNEHFKKLLVLLIVNKMPQLANSYDLNKILSWRFKIININELTSSLLQEKQIEYILCNKNNRKYVLTQTGKDFLITHSTSLKNELKKNYSNESILDIIL